MVAVATTGRATHCAVPSHVEWMTSRVEMMASRVEVMGAFAVKELRRALSCRSDMGAFTVLLNTKSRRNLPSEERRFGWARQISLRADFE